MGDELRDVLKGFSNINTEYDDVVLSLSPSDEVPWQSAMRRCPREILDLIDSKACRGMFQHGLTIYPIFERFIGAIMFNDSLNHEQCERLIFRLSECSESLPFQCAHGRPGQCANCLTMHHFLNRYRPSLVPLTQLGGRPGVWISRHCKGIVWQGFDREV